MTKLEKLMQAVVKAEAAVLAELERLYPVGCQVEYRLRDGVPTKTGKVVRHIGGRDAEIRILLAANPRSSYDADKRYETTLPARKVLRRTDDIHDGG